MCKECGCGIGGAVSLHEPGHEDGFQHHEHQHDHSHAHGSSRVELLGRSLLEKNDAIARRNRALFHEKKLLVLNVLSSPGTGKTTLIRETATRLAGRLRVGVVVGDLATDNDGAELRRAAIPVVQITTGTVCHLDAEMISKAVAKLDLNALDLLIIENVGNLVCPADYDLGEDLRVVLLSVTEGEDKPLKYPPMFHSASVAIITKTDLAAAAGFDRERAISNLERISHHARILELSARTGLGMDEWITLLIQQREAHQNNYQRQKAPVRATATG
jgi:hydrogenase nickel incorporation protein HypB